MQRFGWYLIAYDITDANRLHKVHRRLKKTAIAVQKSVFMAHGTESDIHNILDHVTTVMDIDEDDLRAYPITNPSDVWTNGTNPLAQASVVTFSPQKSMKRRKNNKHRKKMNILTLVIQFIRRSKNV